MVRRKKPEEEAGNIKKLIPLTSNLLCALSLKVIVLFVLACGCYVGE